MARVAGPGQNGEVTLAADRVFDDVSRVDLSPAGHAESRFTFLNRVGGAFWDQVRDLVEEWFAQLPASARADIRGRLRSNDNRQWHGAFWELYLHESLRRAGYEITIHPALGSGSRQPDFLVMKGDATFYLEAKTVFARSTSSGASARRRHLFDEIDKLDNPNFFVSVDIRSDGASNPRGRQIRTALREWLNGLDPDVETPHSLFDDDRNACVWASDGWEIEFRPIPVRLEARGKPNKTLIGVYPPSVGLVTDDQKLRDSLADKGSAYGDLAHPLVVAVNTHTFSPDNFDVMNALYGRLQVTFDPADPRASAVETRAPDGYWAARSWRHRHVAAVLLGRAVTPEHLTRVPPTLWHHPDARQPVPALAPWYQARLDVDHIQFHDPRQSIEDFFDLPDPWPTVGVWEE